MILNTTKEAEALPSLRKAAILLVALGETSSAVLMQQLNEDEVQKVSREVAKMTAITAEQAESVLEEFHHIADAGDYVARGGIEFARKLLMRAFEPDHAKRLLDRLTKALGADAASFDAIQKADPQQLAKFIHNEHPQPIALVLSHLNYSQAAALLTSLPATMRADISQRMASLDQISPEIILKIAAVMQALVALDQREIRARRSRGDAFSNFGMRLRVEVEIEAGPAACPREPHRVDIIRPLLEGLDRKPARRERRREANRDRRLAG